MDYNLIEDREYIKVKCCVCKKIIEYKDEEDCYYKDIDKYLCDIYCEEIFFNKKGG